MSWRSILNRLIAEAERSNGIIEFVPPDRRFCRGRRTPVQPVMAALQSIDENTLRASVAFGSERTIDQDPTFAFRIVVDIALRALSPAINDPTTAVLAIDQLHRMLRMVGKRHLRTDEISGQSGQLRVDFPDAQLGGFCPSRLQRDPLLRLKQSANCQAAAGDDRKPGADASRAPSCSAVSANSACLIAKSREYFTYPEDLALAHIADAQGLGGHSGKIKH